MNAADPTLRTGAPALNDDADDNALLGDGFDAPESAGASELAAEAGIDLSDASALDADNVPADEERDRVLQAPD
jgi:hypothetical protein